VTGERLNSRFDPKYKEDPMGAQWKAKGKAQAADARGKLFGRLAKDIMIAARNGADPAANSRLRLVVEQARKVSMPKETLERAIKKARACWATR
jgi:transcriptional/translational regulatory protein YebC/TACO1